MGNKVGIFVHKYVGSFDGIFVGNIVGIVGIFFFKLHSILERCFVRYSVGFVGISVGINVGNGVGALISTARVCTYISIIQCTAIISL